MIRLFGCLCPWLLLLVLLVPGVLAQPAPESIGPAGPTVEHIQQRLEAVAANTALSETQRSQLQEIYQQVLDTLGQVRQYEESLRTYRRALDVAPEETARLEEELRTLRRQPVVRPDPNRSLSELEAQLTAEQSQKAVLQGQLGELEAQISSLRVRPDQIRTEIAETQRRLGEMSTQSVITATADQPLLQEAQATLYTVRRQALEQRINVLEQELLSHGARLAMAQAQRALLVERMALTESRILTLQQLINARRQREATEAVRQTERTSQSLADRPEVVRVAAERNAELSQQLAKVVEQTSEINRLSQTFSRKLTELQERANSVQQQLEIAGLSNALSPVLRSERRQLPDLQEYREGALQRQQEIIAARLEQFQLEQRRRQLSSPIERVNQLLDELPEPPSGQQRTVLIDELLQLLEDRQILLDKLSSSYASYITQLAELDQTQRRLVDNARQYAELLDEKLFWIASSGWMFDPAWLLRAESALAWLLHPVQWWSVLSGLVESLNDRPATSVPLILAILALLAPRRAMRRRLRSMRGWVGKVQYDRFMFSVESLLWTLLLALPVAVTLIGAGWLLHDNSQLGDFPQAFGAGLMGLGGFLLVTEFLRQLCRSDGLMDLHFRWRERTRNVIRHNLRWFIPVGAITSLIVAMTEWHTDDLYRDTLGRAAFVVGTLAFTLYLARVLHPGRGALSGVLGSSGLAWRLRNLWYPLLLLLPLAMIGLAAGGYYYTALQLQSRLFATGCLVLGLVIVTYMVLRWLNILYRQLALAQARARREARQAARASRDAHATGEMHADVVEAEAIDLEAIGDQARGLLQLAAILLTGLGLWLVWSDLLPALTFLNQVTLWQQVVTTETGDQLTAITLGSLVLALVLLVLLLFVARNLPALIEIILLRRMAMEGGTRYAITTISRYLITIVAMVITLNIIGISWSQAQWLVAALGVGLGFGLQEIFANFVSGLILLLERPIRIGDTITIDNRSGTVSRIRIRATTITDWDNMEIVIPNKTFITGTLINWTLTDPITRVIIPVRVGFSVPLERVRELLLETAVAHPLVLRDPEPLVFLLHMGESSMTFEIRAFVRDIMDRLYTINDLYMRVIAALREEGIEVPFPQRDLHVRTVPPLDSPAEPQPSES